MIVSVSATSALASAAFFFGKSSTAARYSRALATSFSNFSMSARLNGTVMPTTARLMKMCFSYDPEGRTYVFNIVRVTAFVMLSSLAVFVTFLYFTTRRKRRREG